MTILTNFRNAVLHIIHDEPFKENIEAFKALIRSNNFGPHQSALASFANIKIKEGDLHFEAASDGNFTITLPRKSGRNDTDIMAEFSKKQIEQMAKFQKSRPSESDKPSRTNF